MRIAELSRHSGVTAATIKYYVREGLLPAAERTGYNTTVYGEEHLARLRLVRALVETGGLSITQTRRVLEAIEDEGRPLHHVLGAAQRAIPAPATEPSEPSRTRVAAAMAARGWVTSPDNAGIDLVASVLDTHVAVGRPDLGRVLDRYAEAAELVAEVDLDTVAASGTRERMAETVVVGTVLGDTLFAGLRRIAQEHVSRTTQAGGADPAAETCREP